MQAGMSSSQTWRPGSEEHLGSHGSKIINRKSSETRIRESFRQVTIDHSLAMARIKIANLSILVFYYV